MPCMKTRILSKFHSFFLNLLESPSMEVQVAARISASDIRRNLGGNVHLLHDITGANPWDKCTTVMKRMLKSEEGISVRDDDVWRLPYVRKLLGEILMAHYEHEVEKEERFQILINSLVIN